MRNLLFILFFALLGGFFNGLLGTGGGILLIFLLGHLPSLDKQQVFATTVFCIFLMSLLTAILYYQEGMIDLAFSARTFVPAAIGGALGALLLDKIKPTLLRKLFAVMVLYSGFRMVFR